MYRANIYQKNITSNKDKKIIELVEAFNHALVEISSDSILIDKTNGESHKFALEYFEKDQFTTTHLGQFEAGIPFRLIQPYGSSLDSFNIKHSALGAFSFGSINADGYAIHFLLTRPDDIRDNEPLIKADTEQAQRLVQGSIMAVQFGLDEKFLEFSKRLINICRANPEILRTLEQGNQMVLFIKERISLFSAYS